MRTSRVLLEVNFRVFKHSNVLQADKDLSRSQCKTAQTLYKNSLASKSAAPLASCCQQPEKLGMQRHTGAIARAATARS